MTSNNRLVALMTRIHTDTHTLHTKETVATHLQTRSTEDVTVVTTAGLMLGSTWPPRGQD